MADISSVTSSPNAKAQLTSQLSGGDSSLGKDDFLLLMVEQLKNQDPMDPADATEFTAQLAQFSSLEQLFNVNDNLKDMGDTSNEVQRMSALSMIGKDVVTTATDFEFAGTPVQLGYDLEAAADSGSLYIKNSTGVTVATISLADLGKGQHFVEWDGLDDAGHAVSAGDYSLGVAAYDIDDELVNVSGLIRSEVVGVDMLDSGDVLVTTAGEFKLADVKSVRGS